MIGGGRPLKRKCCIKWTFPWRISHADQRFQEIRRIGLLYLHRNYYSGIWNGKSSESVQCAMLKAC